MIGYTPQDVREWMDEYGRTAFETYSGHASGLTHDGKPIPPWDDLTPEVQMHWAMAALAAVAHHVSVTHDVSRETSKEG